LLKNVSVYLTVAIVLSGIFNVAWAQLGDPPTIIPAYPYTYPPYRDAYGVSVGQPFSQMLKATGGVPPYVFNVVSGALPSGFSLDSNTGIISGTTTADGYYDVRIQLSDNSKQSSIATVGFAVIGTRPIVLATALPSASVISGTNVNWALFAAGGTPLPLIYYT
jgi:hypothetical protein